MLTNSKEFWKIIAKTTLKLTIAGLLIGLLHKYDDLITIILILKLSTVVYKSTIQPTKENKNWILPLGMLLTGLLATYLETIGVGNNLWWYNDIDKEIPFWIPLAWMFSFYFIYKLENEIFKVLSRPNLKNKIITTLLIAVFFPWYGEVITINLGTYNYIWPYQILSVPLGIIAGLVVFHMIMNTVLLLICNFYQIKDPVFYTKYK